MSDFLADVIKREGNRPTESFSHEKLHSSLTAACLSARTPAGQAEHIADTVCEHVKQWLQTRPEVTSADLRRVAARKLGIYHEDAAYLYEQHRVTI